MSELSKKIMRRVYYAFLLRKMSHPLFLHLGLLGVSFFALSKAVSIPDVFKNLMAVEVGQVLAFFTGAILHTGTVTIIWLSIISLTLVSLLWRLFKGRRFDVGHKMEWV